MSDSILNDIKRLLGLAEDYDAFDLDVRIHINSALARLGQLGIGPAQGFQIQDAATTWVAFFEGDARLNSIKTYIYLKVRLVWDLPTTSFAIAEFREQIKELEWTINAQREDEKWVKPTTPLATEE